MAKQSFADIFDQWTRMQEKAEKEKEGSKTAVPGSARPDKSRKERPHQTKDFAEILQQWEKDHDDSKELARKARVGSESGKEEQSINRIRRMEAQDELDLHEMTLNEAIPATEAFLESCHKKGCRKVRIVTGKGLHSKNGEAVLKPAITALCQRSPHVREIDTPKASEGGSGALTVILKR